MSEKATFQRSKIEYWHKVTVNVRGNSILAAIAHSGNNQLIINSLLPGTIDRSGQHFVHR
jgi:hypothetical protein